MALTFLTDLSYTIFLRTSFFTTSLSFLKSVEKVFDSSMSNQLTSDFKNHVFLANCHVSTPVASF